MTTQTVSSGSQSNLVVTAGNALVVSGSGSTTSTVVSSGGTMTVISGGSDSGSTVFAGGVVSVGKSGTETNLAVSGGSVVVNGGNAVAINTTVYQGGTVTLNSTSATISGKLTFSGAGTLVAAGNAVSVVSGGAFVSNTTGDNATISGFGAGDIIDITSATTVGSSGTSGVTMAYTTPATGADAGDTVVSVTGHGSSLYYVFAGTSVGSHLELEALSGGVAIEYSSESLEYVSSGVTSSGLTLAAGTILEVMSGGSATSTTVQSGGSALIDAGAAASSTAVANGGTETVLGAETGGTIGGIQIVSGASATISNETIAGGTLGVVGGEQEILGAGVVDLDVAQAAATGIVVSGGLFVLSGSTSATNVTVENVGTVELASPNAALSGTVTLSGDGRIEVATNPVAGAGVQAVISGFGLNDAIDLTSATAIGAAFNAGSATLTSATSGGNTVVTVSGGGSSESFTLAGSVAVNAITDADGGLAIVTLPTITAFTPGDLVISIEGDVTGGYTVGDDQASPVVLEELTTTGSIVGIMVLPQTTEVVNGVTQYAFSGEFGSQSELSLQLSGDGQSLTLMGYGANALAYEADQAAYGSTTFAQTYDTTNSGYIVVPRVVANISYNGSIDTSTALYNVSNTNNPRSVYTINGSQFWVSGQGTGNADNSQGVYFTEDGANTAATIDQSADTRTVTIVNGQLYVSRDNKSVGGGSILDYGTAPTGLTTGTPLAGITNSVTLTASNGNGLFAAGSTAYLSPENYFFASPTVLYIADSGAPKDSGGSEKIGTLPTDGGLQKWVLNTTTNTWSLAYTLSAGLNLVSQDNTVDGTSGLIGLTGTVNATTGQVTFYATNYVLSDFDPTYLYTITDTLSDTTAAQATGESFTTLLSGVPASYNIRGIAFAPQADGATASATVVGSGVTSSGVTVVSGGSITIQNGGTAVATSVEAGGSETVSAGGVVSGSDIVNGTSDTLYGSATGDDLGGSQTVSGGWTGNETILNGGVANLQSAIAIGATVEGGGTLEVGSGSTAGNTVVQGGVVALATPDATLTGVSFDGFGGTIDVTTVPNPGAGVQGVVSGWAAGDVIDFQTIGTAAVLTSATVSGNTAAAIVSGGVSETITISGLAASQLIQLVPDGGSGVELTYEAPPTITVSGGVTSTGLNVYVGTVDVLAGGTLADASIYAGASGVVQYGGTDENSIVYAGGYESVNGNATGDQIYGTQILSAVSSATVSNETVYSGGAIDLFLAGTSGTNLTADSGGELNISGRGTIENVVLNGGTLQLESPKATLSGSLTFEGQSELIYTARNSATSGGLLFGDQAVISGFTGGDAIDLTSAVGIGAGATLTTVNSGGVTTATIGGDGGIPQAFLFAGTPSLVMVADGSGGVEIITQQTASASVAPAPVNFGNVHAGSTATQALSIENTAPAAGVPEALDASFAGTTGAVTDNGGSFTGLLAQQTNHSSLTVGLVTSAAGVQSGTATVALQSDGTNIDGAGLSMLPSQTIAVAGTLYNYASASAEPATINLGIVHAGQPLSQTLTIANTGATGGYTEALDASLGGATGSVTATGSVVGLAAGQTNSAALNIGLSGSNAGVFHGSATLSLTSDGTGIDSLGTTAIGSQTIAVTGTIDNYATASLSDLGGAGTLTAAGGFTVASTPAANAFAWGPNGGLYSTLGATVLGSGGAAETLVLNFASAQNSVNLGFAVGDFLGLDGGDAVTVTDSNGVTATAGAAIPAGSGDLYPQGRVTLDDTTGFTSVTIAATDSLGADPLAVSGMAAYAVSASSAGAFSFGPNGGLYSDLGATVLGSGGVAQTLTLTFAAPQTSLAFAAAVGDFLALDGGDTVTVTDNNGVTATAGAAIPSGSGDLFPQGTVDLTDLAGFTSVTIAATDSLGADPLAISGLSTVPETRDVLNLGTVLQGATAAPSATLAVTNSATGSADLLSGSFAETGATGAFVNSGLAAFGSLAAGASATPTVSLSTAQAGTFTETVTLAASGSNASGYTGALAPEVISVVGTVVNAPTVAVSELAGAGSLTPASSFSFASSPDYAYGPNGGLYSTLGSTVLGSGGEMEPLVLNFASAQNSVSLGFAVGDFLALDGGDAVTVTDSNGVTTTASAAIPAGSGDLYPQGSVTLDDTTGFTSVTIAATDSLGADPLAVSGVNTFAFSSTPSASAFSFGPNGGLYSDLGSTVLGSGGVADALVLNFAAPQTSVSLDAAVGDFLALNGGDAITVSDGAFSQTYTAAIPSGSGDLFPQGTVDFTDLTGFTAVTIAASDSLGAEGLTVSSVSTVPEAREVLNLGSVLQGAPVAPSATLAVTNAATGPADLMSGSFTEGGSTGAFINTGLAAFSGLAAGASSDPTVSLSTAQAGTFTETVTLAASGHAAGALAPEVITVVGTVVNAPTVAVSELAGAGSLTPASSFSFASSPDYAYGPNGGLYSTLGSTVLGSGGEVEPLVLNFASAQNSVSLGFAVGDFLGLDGGDAVTVTDSNGVTTTASSAIPAGSGDLYPQGTVTLDDTAGFTSVTIAASDSLGADPLAVSGVNTFAFSSTPSASAFSFGPNGGLYSDLGATVLGSGGVADALVLHFAAPQTAVSFDAAIGDFLALNGGDAITVSDGAFSQTYTAAIPSGSGDLFPQGAVNFTDLHGFTSVTIAASDSLGAEGLTVSNVTSVPETSDVLNLGTVFQGATVAPAATLAVTNTATGPADLMSGSFTESGSTGAFINTGLAAFSGLGAGASSDPTVSLSTAQAGTFTETVTLTATGNAAGALAPEVITVVGTVVALAAPVLASIAGFGTAVAGANADQAAPASLTYDALAGATVTVYDGTTVVGSETANPAGVATIAISALSAGTHSLTARASLDGGSSIASAAVAFTIAPVTQTTFTLGSGASKLVTGNGDDQINFGNTGSVIVVTGNGYNQISGGDATANLGLGSGGSSVLLGGGNDTVTIAGGSVLVNAGNGNDSITASGSAATIFNVYLGSGNDSVTMGDGTGNVTAGDGNDSVTVGNGNDIVYAGNGSDTITAGNGNDYIQAGGGSDTIMVGSGTGGIQLGDGNDVVNAGAGNQTILLGNGNDSVNLGTGTDFLRLGTGTNTVTGTAGAKTLDLFGDGTNTVTLSGGNELIYGTGTDTINAGGGNNIISMQGGQDTVTAGNGNNTVQVINASAANSITLGNGTNKVILGTGGATVTVGSGANYIEAFGGTNTIAAGDNSGNVVKADSGVATITLGAGSGTGNGSSDTFILGNGGGNVTGGWGSNVYQLNGGAWFIATATGSDTVELASTSAFADVQTFNTATDLLEVSSAAFGLGLGLTGSQTQAIGGLLSTTTDGSFSSSSALFAYNAATGVVSFRPDAASGASAIADLANDPSNISGFMLVRA
jgi:autotransporter passenger strand-loop-strand repeat protein